MTSYERHVTNKATLETWLKALAFLPIRFGREGQSLLDELANTKDPARLEEIFGKAIIAKDFAELKQMIEVKESAN